MVSILFLIWTRFELGPGRSLAGEHYDGARETRSPLDFSCFFKAVKVVGDDRGSHPAHGFPYLAYRRGISPVPTIAADELPDAHPDQLPVLRLFHGGTIIARMF